MNWKGRDKRVHILSNLKDQLKNVMQGHHRLGRADTNTAYYSSLEINLLQYSHDIPTCLADFLGLQRLFVLDPGWHLRSTEVWAHSHCIREHVLAQPNPEAAPVP